MNTTPRHSRPTHHSPSPMPDLALLEDILQWDVSTWAAALRIWELKLPEGQGGQVLDVGARDGGLSLYFALKGFSVTCSDLQGPSSQAIELHRKYAVSDRVTYATVDATQMPYPEASFDIVCFKSVLGGIGYGGRYDRQKQALAEMHRVLRPGGLLLFAENLVGCVLHRFFRRRFVRWAASWRYLDLTDIPDLFAPFDKLDFSCHGVLATFGRSERQRRVLHGIDRVLDRLLPDRSKYMMAGTASKNLV